MSYVTSETAKLKEWIKQQSIPSYDFITASTSWPNAFIPAGVVETHFQTPFDNYRRTSLLLQEIFDGAERVPAVSAKFVSHKCCRVMCILVLVERPDLITSFTGNDALYDDKLPFDPRLAPPDFPEPEKDGFYLEFVKQQWRFFAPKMEIHYGWGVKNDRILPFTDGRKISSKPGSTVHKVHVHESHDKLVERTGDSEPVSHWYALKSFKGRDAERNFDRESLAFMNISAGQSVKPPGMIGFYQSFHYRDTFNILLEFADGDTLEKFFLDRARPTTGAEIIDFWESLLGIIKGVCVLHRPMSRGRGASVNGWHQDLKPENILVMRNHKDSGYRWDFKVADLALCHFKTVMERSADKLDLDFDAFGTRTYAAPECLGESKFTQFAPKLISNAVDIWSLGCILAEACVWTVKGMAGLEAFRILRKEATDGVLEFRNGRGGDCFHNGRDLLPDLESQLNGLKRQCYSYDFVTGRVIDRLVLGMLITEPEARLSAPQLQGSIETIIPRARSDLAEASGASGSSVTEPSVTVTESADSSYHNRMASDSSEHPPGRVLRGPSFIDSPEPAQTPNESTVDVARTLLIQTQPSQFESSDMQARLEEHQEAIDERARDAARARSETLESAFLATRGFDYVSDEAAVGGAADVRSEPKEIPTREVGNGHRKSENSLEITSSPEFAKKIPDVPVAKALRWFHDIKDESTVISETLPHAHLLSNLTGRDQVFIVDDSLSMKQHKRDIKDLLRLLAWMTKTYDKDKLELLFLKSDSYHKSKSSKKLAQALDLHRFDGTTDLSKRFADILQQYGRELDPSRSPLRDVLHQKKQPKKKSIYVFTDGKLETGDAEQGHEEIKALVYKIKNAGLMRDQVGIQFISFGDDREGLDRLDSLDNLARTAGLPFDIVDTEPSTGNIWKILLGGFKPRFDQDLLAIATPVSPSAGPSARP